MCVIKIITNIRAPIDEHEYSIPFYSLCVGLYRHVSKQKPYRPNRLEQY